MHYRTALGYFILPAMVAVVTVAACAPRHPTEDRVPPSAMKEALSYKAPFGDARTAQPEIVAGGKALYEGKGRCALCHGTSGKGDGPAAHMHPPHPPRDFTDCAFQKEREDGELFWIIKNGSPGTGMKPMIPGMLSEEDGWKLVAYIRTFCTAHS
ncbi:c-type cytochrome [Nitrospira sp. NS4]|uniref:c-type cytochrome n=1 Tax=Nitrospira sp. NS4 TaxID=3414498 RepID=UPI003C2BC346